MIKKLDITKPESIIEKINEMIDVINRIDERTKKDEIIGSQINPYDLNSVAKHMKRKP